MIAVHELYKLHPHIDINTNSCSDYQVIISNIILFKNSYTSKKLMNRVILSFNKKNFLGSQIVAQ